jgi:rubredoxin
VWYCTICDYHFSGERKIGCSIHCPKCGDAKNVVDGKHPFAHLKSRGNKNE